VQTVADNSQIDTEGGSVIQGNVEAGRDVIGRDFNDNRAIVIGGSTVVALTALIILGVVVTVIVLSFTNRLKRGLSSWLTWPTVEVVPNSMPEMLWVEIPEGNFSFGLDEEDLSRTLAACEQIEGHCDEGWFDQERPQQERFLKKFQITKYEISNAQYSRCVSAHKCAPLNQDLGRDSPPKPEYFEHHAPVVVVGYAQAATFCAWIKASLPDEQQWEKAARGTDGRLYPWGDEFVQANANLATTLDIRYALPSPVDSYLSGGSPYGVLNMAGNVFEWTSSKREGQEDQYVLRGGSWRVPYYRGRVTDRGTSVAPTYAHYDIGFRCVR
jgi:formylglycine-generating enzyme required for sulfatase activity